MDNKVRIISDKGEIKFVSPKIAKNEKLLKSYGYKVEDFKKEEKKEGKGIEKVLLEETPVFTDSPVDEVDAFEPETIEERVVMDVPTIEFVREQYTALTGKKPGIKKLETLLNEMNEINGLNK